MLFEDREISVRGAYAYLKSVRHGRRTHLTTLEHRDEHLLLPLGDVHPGHTVRVPSPRRRLVRRLLFLGDGLVTGHGDGYHGAATDVVLDGDRTTSLLGRRAGDAEARADTTYLSQSLWRGAAETELHRTALVLHARPFVRDAHDVAFVENGDDHPAVAGMNEVLHYLTNRLFGNVASSLSHLLRHKPAELPCSRTRVRSGDLGYLRLAAAGIDRYAKAYACL